MAARKSARILPGLLVIAVAFERPRSGKRSAMRIEHIQLDRLSLQRGQLGIEQVGPNADRLAQRVLVPLQEQ